MDGSLLQQGATLMLVGMGTVFVFLTALVIAMTAMTAVTKRFNKPEPQDGISDDEVAAITAAIARHRSQ